MQDPNVFGLLLNAGAAGILLFLFLKGWIVPKPSMDRAEREITYLKKALADERATSKAERETHRLESAPANAAALEAARTTAHLLAGLKDRTQQPEVSP